MICTLCPELSRTHSRIVKVTALASTLHGLVFSLIHNAPIQAHGTKTHDIHGCMSCEVELWDPEALVLRYFLYEGEQAVLKTIKFYKVCVRQSWPHEHFENVYLVDPYIPKWMCLPGIVWDEGPEDL